MCTLLNKLISYVHTLITVFSVSRNSGYTVYACISNNDLVDNIKSYKLYFEHSKKGDNLCFVFLKTVFIAGFVYVNAHNFV